MEKKKNTTCSPNTIMCLLLLLRTFSLCIHVTLFMLLKGFFTEHYLKATSFPIIIEVLFLQLEFEFLTSMSLDIHTQKHLRLCRFLLM